jgi:hypothetical protein
MRQEPPSGSRRRSGDPISNLVHSGNGLTAVVPIAAAAAAIIGVACLLKGHLGHAEAYGITALW